MPSKVNADKNDGLACHVLPPSCCASRIDGSRIDAVIRDGGVRLWGPGAYLDFRLGLGGPVGRASEVVGKPLALIIVEP